VLYDHDNSAADHDNHYQATNTRIGELLHGNRIPYLVDVPQVSWDSSDYLASSCTLEICKSSFRSSACTGTACPKAGYTAGQVSLVEAVMAMA
jgi:hypothetical protein